MPRLTEQELEQLDSAVLNVIESNQDNQQYSHHLFGISQRIFKNLHQPNHFQAESCRPCRSAALNQSLMNAYDIFAEQEKEKAMTQAAAEVPQIEVSPLVVQ